MSSAASVERRRYEKRWLRNLSFAASEAFTRPATKEVSAMQNIVVGRYEHPDSTDYLGWIEPEDQTWIVFVRNDHTAEVYLDRDPETGAVL